MKVYFWLAASALCFAVGEYFSKVWVDSRSWWLVACTMLAYTLGALAWFPALAAKPVLSTTGAMWSVFSLTATVLLGVIVFKERPSADNVIGLMLAPVVVYLLSL